MADKSKLTSATARVRITLDVPAGSSWGADCSLDQIFRQAGRETEGKVIDALLKSGLRATVVSSEVTAVSAVEQKP